MLSVVNLKLQMEISRILRFRGQRQEQRADDLVKLFTVAKRKLFWREAFCVFVADVLFRKLAGASFDFHDLQKYAN